MLGSWLLFCSWPPAGNVEQETERNPAVGGEPVSANGGEASALAGQGQAAAERHQQRDAVDAGAGAQAQ